jgi:exodeoxyribonuclease V
MSHDDDGAQERHVDVTVKNEFWSGREGDLEWQDKKGTEEFTYGYALTCHKAQGSQWDEVIVFDESSTFREDKNRWLYTATTRAAERLTIVI